MMTFVRALMLVRLTNAVITDPSLLPTFPPTFCSFSQQSQATLYNAFVTGMTSNLTFDANTGWSVVTYELCNPAADVQRCNNSYQMEAKRILGPMSSCQTCPYHLDAYWTKNNPYTTTGQFNNLFGPCFNGLPSLQTVCMQHPALAPVDFTGQYHYPMQLPLADSVWTKSIYGSPPPVPMPMHLFLSDGPSSTTDSTQDPSLYGLGKRAVLASLSSVQLVNRTTGQPDERLTNAFLAPFRTVNNVEQWLKWAQFFCLPACHRDSRYTPVMVRQVDIDQNPQNYYLSTYLYSGPNQLARCTPCPRYAAAYDWDEGTDAPFDPRANLFATQCYPWFGAIPTIVLDAQSGLAALNVTYVPPGEEVLSLQSIAVVTSVECPVNTYNRVCAHAKRYYFMTKQVAKYECTPCPPGYHTAGLRGQWYCRPPPGVIFTFQPLVTQMPNLWSNRDLLSAAQGFRELECGYSPAHCLQSECAPGMLPEEFNERWVFSKLLQTRSCTSGSYCPDAFTELPCPSARPWSPPNSSSLAQCACRAGSFLGGDGVCQPCTTVCAQPAGYYLPLSQCVAKDGALADAPCLPCTNVPAAYALSTGNGFELPGVGGVCPFACSEGALLTQQQLNNTQQGLCSTPYACQPIAEVPRNAGGQYLFYTGGALPLDALTVKGTACQKVQLLTSVLNTLLPTEWAPQPTSCWGQCGRQLCYASLVSSFASTPWYALAAPLACVPCPAPSQLPANAEVAPYVALAQATACSPYIRCSTEGLYFNTTAWECQSCTVREARVCPPGTRLRGQGCLMSTAPFNVSAPDADCLRCSLSMPNPAVSGVSYLNYNSPLGTTETGGCAIEPCAPLLPLYYWATPCAGDRSGTQASCNLTNCPPLQYRLSACTRDADRVCAPCTVSKPGYHMTATCSFASDSLWSPCPVGFYCVGDGSKTACPSLRTSQPMARLRSDCYCDVGTQEDPITAQCLAWQCPGTTLDPSLPGRSLISSRYMTLDPSTRSSTICLPCGAGTTRGDGKELGACACPSGQAAVPNASGGIACVPCASSPPACSDPLALARPCARTLLSSSAQPCECALAPFSALNAQQSSGSACASTCQQGYMPTGPPRTLRGSPRVTGALLYATDSAWTGLPTQSKVTSFAVTGELDDSVLKGGTYHAEHLLWTMEGTPYVHAQPILQPEAPVQEWQVFGAAVGLDGTQYTLIQIGVSRWTAQRSTPLYVAALVLLTSPSQQQRLLLAINRLQPQGTWMDSPLALNTTLYSGPQPVEVVGLTHSSTALGMNAPQPGGFFYIAYNRGGACGGLLMVSPAQLAQSEASVCGLGALQGLSVRQDPGSGYPIVFLLVGGALYKLDLVQGLLPSQPVIGASALVSGSLAAISPNILLAVDSSSGALVVADALQWTWTALPGLPYGTAPSLQRIASTGLTPTTTLLVVAHEAALFSIAVAQCALGSYWDGVGCVAHTCVRLPQCDSTRKLVNNQCVCIAGYYQSPTSLLCVPCPKGSYCSGGISTACPGPTLTTLSAYSTSINDCVCASTGYFYSTAAASCLPCPPNAWCPNRWSVFACPGASGSLIVGGSQFPVVCTCQAGFAGPSCEPCPASFYCPASSTATAVNMAAFFGGVPPDAIPSIKQALLKYFLTTGSRVTSVNTLPDLERLLYINVVPPTNQTQQGLMVMVQLPNAQITGWKLLLQLLLASSNYTVSVTPSGDPIQQTVASNTPAQCLTGKTPASPIASTCVCAPGYTPNAQQCAPCEPNTFKAEQGDAKCVPCAVGLVAAAAGASACTQGELAPASPADNTTLLAAGVGGGILGLILLVCLLQSLFAAPHRS